jgi:hypothetical protein
VDSGFTNSIYWNLPVVTTVIRFTTLQPINQRLVFWFGITSDFLLNLSTCVTFHFVALSVSVSPFILSLSLSPCISICLQAQSAIPLRQSFANWIGDTLLKGWVVAQTISCWRANRSLPSRWVATTVYLFPMKWQAVVMQTLKNRYLENDSSIPAFRHFVRRLFSYLRLGLPSDVFPSGLRIETVYVLLFSPVHVTYHSHSS